MILQQSVRTIAVLSLVFSFTGVSVFAQQADIDPMGASPESCIDLSSNLRYLSTDSTTNNAVSRLQNFLITKGHMKVEATGFFGPITFNSVKTYQTSKGISNTGFVGEYTRAAIKADTCGAVVGQGNTTNQLSNVASAGNSPSTSNAGLVVTNGATPEVRSFSLRHLVNPGSYYEGYPIPLGATDSSVKGILDYTVANASQCALFGAYNANQVFFSPSATFFADEGGQTASGFYPFSFFRAAQDLTFNVKLDCQNYIGGKTTSKSLVFKVPGLLNPTGSQPGATFCTQEVFVCPNGATVGREGPSCSFKTCPTGGAQSTTPGSSGPRISVQRNLAYGDSLFIDSTSVLQLAAVGFLANSLSYQCYGTGGLSGTSGSVPLVNGTARVESAVISAWKGSVSCTWSSPDGKITTEESFRVTNSSEGTIGSFGNQMYAAPGIGRIQIIEVSPSATTYNPSVSVGASFSPTIEYEVFQGNTCTLNATYAGQSKTVVNDSISSSGRSAAVPNSVSFTKVAGPQTLGMSVTCTNLDGGRTSTLSRGYTVSDTTSSESGTIYQVKPTASITINGAKRVTLTPGEPNTKTWSSSGGTQWSSVYTVYGLCSAAGSSGAWSASTAEGSESALATDAFVGCTAAITYTVANMYGSVSDTIYMDIVARN